MQKILLNNLALNESSLPGIGQSTENIHLWNEEQDRQSQGQIDYGIFCKSALQSSPVENTCVIKQSKLFTFSKFIVIFTLLYS